MPGNIGPLEIAIVVIIALLVFGPKRLPELGRSLGKGIREFKGSIGGERDDDDDAGSKGDDVKAIGASPATAESTKPPADAEVAHDKHG
ncbi:MAG TPA: twin-arginine translocase TatA/TatE family subunit [Solirubrobacterales bacterium]|nr:twin-arginine translocase TatA/TatE family subunit [Solirubrobacterales bacterium]